MVYRFNLLIPTHWLLGAGKLLPLQNSVSGGNASDFGVSSRNTETGRGDGSSQHPNVTALRMKWPMITSEAENATVAAFPYAVIWLRLDRSPSETLTVS